MEKDNTAAARRQKSAWLGRYRAALRRQELLAQELAELRAGAEHIGAAGPAVPGRTGPDAARLPRAVERIAAAEEALEAQIAACLQCRAEVASAIGGVEHAQQQEVLRRRYLLGQTYAEIADAMGLVERRIFQLHRQAIERISVNHANDSADSENDKTDFSNTTL